MKRITNKLIILGAILFPSLAFAQQAFTTLQSIINRVAEIVQTLIPIAFALGILGFFWGLALYVFAAGNEEKKAEGKNIMLWGLIALFVMASVFGIIRLAQTTLGTTENSPIQPPRINVR